MANNSINSSASSSTFQSIPRRMSPRKRTGQDNAEHPSATAKVSRKLLDDSQQQSKFSIKPLRAMTVQLSPYLDEEHVHQLSYLLELPRKEIESSKRPLLAFLEEAEKRGRITATNVDVLFQGLSNLAPSEKINKATEIVKSYNVPDVKKQKELSSSLEMSTSKTTESHWKKFYDWCMTKDISEARKATCEDVIKYLTEQYPRIRVTTISKHYSSIKEKRGSTDSEEKQIQRLLKELTFKEAERQKKQNDKN